MKTILKWLAGLLAQHVFLQIVAAPFIAYGLGWIVSTWKGAEAMLDSLPPWFWPILATLVILVTVYPAFIVPIVEWQRGRRTVYRAEVENAYGYVSQAYKPEILNREHPGNPEATKELAQNAVDELRPKLQRKRRRLTIPDVIDVDSRDCLREWYDFLREERARIS